MPATPTRRLGIISGIEQTLATWLSLETQRHRPQRSTYLRKQRIFRRELGDGRNKEPEQQLPLDVSTTPPQPWLATAACCASKPVASYSPTLTNVFAAASRFPAACDYQLVPASCGVVVLEQLLLI